MKYSLQSLMIVVAVAGIAFGRIAHLKRWAEYHDREAERLVSEKVAKGWTRESVNKTLERWDDWQLTTYSEITTHRQLANEYRTAMYRPWTIVKERPAPPPQLQSSSS